jgi:hypothetical protein
LHVLSAALRMDQNMKHLEQKLEEASDTMTEKDWSLSELQLVTDDGHRPMVQTAPVNINQLEMELESHVQEKVEAGIQCLVMVKAGKSVRRIRSRWVSTSSVPPKTQECCWHREEDTDAERAGRQKTNYRPTRRNSLWGRKSWECRAGLTKSTSFSW